MPNNFNNKQIITIFGGTFDPPHNGHLLPLQETADILELSQVELMPTNVPALKQGISERHHRIEMTRLLCELDSRFKINLTEFERDSISYTVNTLKLIKRKRPEHPIIFIVGLDSLSTLDQWHKWEMLFDYCHLVVMLRPSINDTGKSNINLKSNSSKMASNLYNFYINEREFDNIVGKELSQTTRLMLLSKLTQPKKNQHSINRAAFKDIISNSAKGNLWFVRNQDLPVSSTFIRQQIKSGKAINKLVPRSIIDYIEKHQLYKI